MRRALLMLLICVGAFSNANAVIYDLGNFLDEISCLFASEQMDVVHSKMLNHGFKLIKSVPDYELNGKQHKWESEYRYFGDEYYGTISFTCEVSDDVNDYEIIVNFESDQSEGEVKEVNNYFLHKPNFKMTKSGYDVIFYNLRDTTYLYGRSGDYIKGFIPLNLKMHADPSRYKIWVEIDLSRPRFPVVDFLKNPKQAFNEKQIDKILLKKHGNHFLIPVIISSTSFDFLFDTGASDFLINERIEKLMLSKGLITNKSYLPSKVFEIADGSQVECRMVKIPRIKIGGTIINNVTAGIVKGNSDPLFGMAVFKKYKSWNLDSKSGILTIHKF